MSEKAGWRCRTLALEKWPCLMPLDLKLFSRSSTLAMASESAFDQIQIIVLQFCHGIHNIFSQNILGISILGLIPYPLLVDM